MRRTITAIQADPDYLGLDTPPPLSQCVEIGGWQPVALTLYLFDGNGAALLASADEVEVDLLVTRAGLPLSAVAGGPFTLVDRTPRVVYNAQPGSLFVRLRSTAGLSGSVGVATVEVDQVPLEADIAQKLLTAQQATVDALAAASAASVTASAAQAAAAQALDDLAVAVAGGPVDRRGWELFEDFIGGPLATAFFTHGWTRVASGTTSGTIISAPGHDGVLRVTATTLAARLTYHLGADTIDPDPTSKTFGWEVLVRVPTLGDGTDHFACLVGLNDGVGLTGDGTNAVQLKYDSTVSANWILQLITAGVPANFDSFVPVVAGEWIAVRFRLNVGGGGDCYFATPGEEFASGIGPFGGGFTPNPVGPVIKVEKSLGNANARGFDLDYVRYFARYPALR